MRGGLRAGIGKLGEPTAGRCWTTHRLEVAPFQSTMLDKFLLILLVLVPWSCLGDLWMFCVLTPGTSPGKTGLEIQRNLDSPFKLSGFPVFEVSG